MTIRSGLGMRAGSADGEVSMNGWAHLRQSTRFLQRVLRIKGGGLSQLVPSRGDALVRSGAREWFSRPSAGSVPAGGLTWLRARRCRFSGGDENQSGGFRSRGFPLPGDSAGDQAAAVAVEQLEQRINHEVETKNAKGQEYR